MLRTILYKYFIVFFLSEVRIIRAFIYLFVCLHASFMC